MALLVMLLAEVITSDLTEADLERPAARPIGPSTGRRARRHGPRRVRPGLSVLHLLASVPSKALIQVGDEAPAAQAQLVIRR
ncbi:MAG: hypothetical protein R3C10_00915 [Pirellulales bacterium]